MRATRRLAHGPTRRGAPKHRRCTECWPTSLSRMRACTRSVSSRRTARCVQRRDGQWDGSPTAGGASHAARLLARGVGRTRSGTGCGGVRIELRLASALAPAPARAADRWGIRARRQVHTQPEAQRRGAGASVATRRAWVVRGGGLARSGRRLGHTGVAALGLRRARGGVRGGVSARGPQDSDARGWLRAAVRLAHALGLLRPEGRGEGARARAEEVRSG